MTKLFLVAVLIFSAVGFSQERRRVKSGSESEFRPVTDIVYDYEKDGMLAYVSCDGFWVNNVKQRIFSVTVKDKNGKVFGHSMNCEDLVEALLAKGFSKKEIEAFRDLLCSTKKAFNLSASDKFDYKKVLNAAINIAWARSRNPETREKDAAAVSRIYKNRDPDVRDDPPRPNAGPPADRFHENRK